MCSTASSIWPKGERPKPNIARPKGNEKTSGTGVRIVREGADEFLLPITQEELAGMVGASRERVNKAIASFIRLGYIDQHERHYTILKRDAMELRAR